MDLIVGAGVTGISYATFTNNDYLILEKESRIGGYCRTVKKGPFVWDYSGHFFHFRNPELEELVCRHIDKTTLKSVSKKTQILYKDKYIDFPFQKNIHQLDKDEFIDCLYDLFAEKEGKRIESFKDMIYEDLGKSIAEKFLVPYNEKLYACDLDTLDHKAMGRFFPKTNKEEIIHNFRKNETKSYNDSFVYPTGGAIEYINSLFKNVSENQVSLNENLERIDLDNKIAYTNIREIKYDRLISTMPFPKLLELCNIEYKREIFTWNKVLVFNLGFDSGGSYNKNSWVYIPNPDIVFYRVGFYNNIIGMDKMSLYVEIGFPSTQGVVNIADYLSRVLSDLKQLRILRNQKLIDYHHVIMDPAYVHINKKSSQIVESYKEQLSINDVYSIGRYGSWTYCSIEDNIIEARELVRKIK